MDDSKSFKFVQGTLFAVGVSAITTGVSFISTQQDLLAGLILVGIGMLIVYWRESRKETPQTPQQPQPPLQ